MVDIIIVTRGTKEEHTQKVESVLTKLENKGHKASKKIKILPERNGLAATHHFTRRNQTKERKKQTQLVN